MGTKCIFDGGQRQRSPFDGLYIVVVVAAAAAGRLLPLATAAEYCDLVQDIARRSPIVQDAPSNVLL